MDWGTLKAHSSVLRTASPVLRALLSTPMKEGARMRRRAVRIEAVWVVGIEAMGC